MLYQSNETKTSQKQLQIIFKQLQTTYTIDPVIAGIMLLHVDVTVEDWNIPKAVQYGIKNYHTISA